MAATRLSETVGDIREAVEELGEAVEERLAAVEARVEEIDSEALVDRPEVAALVDKALAARFNPEAERRIRDMLRVEVARAVNVEVARVLHTAVMSLMYIPPDGAHSAADDVPAAACPRCGGWTPAGGMSQHAGSTEPVLGRPGCTCTGIGGGK